MSKYVPMAVREKREEREGKGTREKEKRKDTPRVVAPTDPFFSLSHSKWELHVVVGKQFNRVRSFFLFVSFSCLCGMCEIASLGVYFEGMGEVEFLSVRLTEWAISATQTTTLVVVAAAALYPSCLILFMDGTVMLWMWCKGIRNC
ncbi:uncharacterized protein TrAtP1_013331 [Trichoderma atroviride]|uniref:uncharacterized protein n=1 Tax=Hypocrea atroviridis TaxID=63577 RepID=UPI0033314C8C|nr:hypothetical protein TrAtP1_013331 [Trichoderma atroviride]